jgi:TolB-like protein/Tfp pilus assembly protein PilF
MSLITELNRRGVTRVAIAYVATAWLLIQAAETLFPVYGLSDNSIRVVVSILAIGLLPALILSWVFEFTPKGLRRETDASIAVPEGRPGAHKTFDRVVILILALGMAYFAVDKFVLAPEREASLVEETRRATRDEVLAASHGSQSIAVLPFANLSPDPAQAYFADGIAEEILNLLAKVPGLRVTSRASAFTFRDEDVNFPELAAKLNVAHILEGTVRTAGERLRIMVQLVDAQSGTSIWSETYDRTLEDIFAIQDDVVEEVISQLRLNLPEERHHVQVVDPVAHARFLEARRLIGTARENAYQDAEALLGEALAIEPNYVQALVLMSDIYAFQLSSATEEERERLQSKVNGYRIRVLGLDPDNADVLATMAWDEMDLRGDFASAARLLERATRREPTNFNAVFASGALAKELGRFDLAIRLLQYAAERDPLSLFHHHGLAETYSIAGRHEEALRQHEVAMTLIDRPGAFTWAKGMNLLRAGDAAGALESFDQALDPDLKLQGQVLALHDLGREADSREALAQLDASRNSVLPELASQGNQFEILRWAWMMGITNAYVGNIDTAFRELEAARALQPSLLSISQTPELQSLHGDERWPELLRSLGQSPEQLAAIEFNPTLPPDLRRF